MNLPRHRFRRSASEKRSAAFRSLPVPAIRPARILALCAAVLFISCSRQPSHPARTSDTVASNSSPQIQPAITEQNPNLPQVGGVEGYVGSADCRSCHQEQFDSWHRSYHRTMTQLANTNSVQAHFHNVILTNDSVRFTLSQRTNEFWVRMEQIQPEPGPVPPQAAEVQIGLITGSHHMQVFWAPSGEGNAQLGFPFTWLIPEKRWVPRHSTFIRPPDAVHRSEIWNVICSRCHATGIQPRVDPVARTVSTRAAELGIACEACHGPGKQHVEARLTDQKKRIEPAAEVIRKEIVHPEHIEPVRAAQICGFCHSMKWFDRSEPWRQLGFRYRPGDDLEATTPIIRPAHVGKIPGLADFLSRNPDLLNDFFWPDGMIRVSGREYNGLLESPCYTSSKFSCLSCHSLHKSDPNDQLARNRIDNRACTQCHDTFREPPQLMAHTRHLAGSSGSECYNCHMPHTTYGVLKAIRSHQISSPNVAEDLDTGRPNACNLCHLDRTLDWTADRLTEWYGQPKPGLPAYSRNTAHVVRLALAGDAGQRALAAWHLGWPIAQQISGTNWITPILAQLLDDPYAAVRCVSERALRGHSKLVPADYDFTHDPNRRPPVHDRIWRQWKNEMGTEPAPFKPEILSNPIDLDAQRTAFEAWLQQRDNRPVRLRE